VCQGSNSRITALLRFGNLLGALIGGESQSVNVLFGGTFSILTMLQFRQPTDHGLTLDGYK
jgi:hypothetical protein